MAARYLTLTLILLGVGLCLDGAHMRGGAHMPALQMLIYGPWGVPFGLTQWFANPLFALAILAHRRYRRLSLGLGLWALYLAATSITLERLPDNQSYAFHDVTHLGLGFYLWSSAMVVFCLGQGWQVWTARSRQDVPGWSWPDLVLLVAIGGLVYGATQLDSLRFDSDQVLMPPVQTVL